MNTKPQLSEEMENQVNEILHEWFKRVVVLELDTDLKNRIHGKGGFWTIECSEIKQLIAITLKKQRDSYMLAGAEYCEKVKKFKPKWEKEAVRKLYLMFLVDEKIRGEAFKRVKEIFKQYLQNLQSNNLEG